MRWKEGNYSNDNVVIDDLTNGADLVCRAPDSRTTPDSYANWERNRRIIIQAPAMLDMLKRVVHAADGGPVIQASEIEALIAAAEPNRLAAETLSPPPDLDDLWHESFGEQPANSPRPTPLDFSNRPQITFRPETRLGYSPQARFSLESGGFWRHLPNGGRITESAFRAQGDRIGPYISGMDITASSIDSVDMRFTLRDGRGFEIRHITPEFHHYATDLYRAQPTSSISQPL